VPDVTVTTGRRARWLGQNGTGERVTARAVVREHVPRGAARREQHGVTGHRQAGGRPHDVLHHVIFRAGDLVNRDLGRVSCQRVADHPSVPADQHGRAQAMAYRGDQVVEVGVLGQTAGHPHDVRVRRE